MTDKKHPVIELFGPTLQGEGAMFGKMSDFLRFGGCPYRCSWCDSMHAVLPEEVKKNAEYLTAEEIFARIRDLESPVDWITFTGGDPVMHNLDELVDRLNGRIGHTHMWTKRIAVETQGSLWQDWLTKVSHVTVSPKPPSSGMDEKFDEAIAMRYWNGIDSSRACVKFVIFTPEDLDWAQDIQLYFPAWPIYLSVGTPTYTRPKHALESDKAEDLAAIQHDILLRWDRLFDLVKRRPRLRSARILPQGHVLLWGNKLGV